MIAALVLAAVVPPVESAERAFASAAQTSGQWTAFRAFAAPDAQMMIDGPQPAAPFLKNRKDPSVALMWWPAHTITSCDRTLAFSTGPWRRDGGRKAGRYMTMWRHDAGKWRWVYDGGSESHSDLPAGDRPKAVFAACGRRSAAPVRSQHEAIGGASRDGSLQWSLTPADGRHFSLEVHYWTGRTWTTERAMVG